MIGGSSGLNTEYMVVPDKPSPVNPVVKSDFEKKNINLEALFDGGNPFEAADAPASKDTPEEEDDSGRSYDAGEEDL